MLLSYSSLLLSVLYSFNKNSNCLFSTPYLIPPSNHLITSLFCKLLLLPFFSLLKRVFCHCQNLFKQWSSLSCHFPRHSQEHSLTHPPINTSLARTHILWFIRTIVNSCHLCPSSFPLPFTVATHNVLVLSLPQYTLINTHMPMPTAFTCV